MIISLTKIVTTDNYRITDLRLFSKRKVFSLVLKAERESASHT